MSSQTLHGGKTQEHIACLSHTRSSKSLLQSAVGLHGSSSLVLRTDTQDRIYEPLDDELVTRCQCSTKVELTVTNQHSGRPKTHPLSPFKTQRVCPKGSKGSPTMAALSHFDFDGASSSA